MSAEPQPLRPQRVTSEPADSQPLEATGPSARTRAILDRCSVTAFGAAWLAALIHLAPSLALAFGQAERFLLLPVGLLSAYVLADFLAGSVHWLADRCFAPDTPVLGPLLITPFRAHHEDALSISRHDFFEVSGNNALVSLPLALALLALPEAVDAWTTFLAIFGLGLCLALVATNQFHGWAHARRPPKIARRLQRLGLILTPEGHAKHHRADHDRAYCVTSGWLNPLLDRLRFFDRLERLIARQRSVTGHPSEQ